MGYCTYYTLDNVKFVGTNLPENLRKVLVETIKTNYKTLYKKDIVLPDAVQPSIKEWETIIEHAVNEKYLWKNSEVKWYTHIEDMKKISLDNPNYIFYTSGVGEEYDDQWKAKFYNGKSEVVKAEIVFRNFEGE